MSSDMDRICDICAKKFTSKKGMLLHKISHTETFNCDPCAIQYERKVSLKRHIDTIHNENAKFTCSYCQKKSGGKNEHERHIKIHDTETFYKFACTYCQRKCKTEDSVQNHIKYTHTKPKKQECSLCYMKFAYRSTLLSHQSHVHQTKTAKELLECDLCGKKLRSETTLRVHKQMHTGEKPYKCETCEQTFRQAPHLKSHNFIAHVRVSKSKCDLCSLEFYDVNRHIKRKHNDDNKANQESKCNQCPLTFPSKSGARIHLNQVHRNAQRKKCNFCDYSATNNQMLVSHNRIHTGERPFKCSYCDHAASQDNIIKTHIQIHHTNENEMVECDLCLKTVRKRGIQTHKKSHNTNKPFKCPKCESSFRNESLLKHHSSIHTDIRPFSCLICPKQFKRKSHLHVHQEVHDASLTSECRICFKKVFHSNLQLHLKTHKEQNLFICTICDKHLKTPATLKDHSKVHSKIKPFSCPQCPASFSQSFSRTKHLRTHIKMKKTVLVCHQCDKEFVSKVSLKLHKQSQHDGITYGCDVCTKIYASQSGLKAHKNFIHNPFSTKYVCTDCDKKFTTKEYLRSHRRSLHEGFKYPCPKCQEMFSWKITMEAHKKDFCKTDSDHNKK